MTSSNITKVLSYEDIDELNQQVVERPVTIFHNLNAPAPCDEDNAEPTSVTLKEYFFFFLVSYCIHFFLLPTICIIHLARICCGHEDESQCTFCISKAVCLINLVFVGWLFLFLFWYAPYSLIYFAVVFVATIIHMLCRAYGIIEEV